MARKKPKRRKATKKRKKRKTTRKRKAKKTRRTPTWSAAHRRSFKAAKRALIHKFNRSA